MAKTNTLGSRTKKIPKARPISKTDINAKSIKKIRAHLSKMDPYEGNKVMIERLEKIASGELKPTKTDLRFYTHELREQKLMKMGMTYEEAHVQALKDYGIEYVKGYERQLYTKEAIFLGEQGLANEFS